jgi:hypothetical protein
MEDTSLATVLHNIDQVKTGKLSQIYYVTIVQEDGGYAPCNDKFCAPGTSDKEVVDQLYADAKNDFLKKNNLPVWFYDVQVATYTANGVDTRVVKDPRILTSLPGPNKKTNIQAAMVI